MPRIKIENSKKIPIKEVCQDERTCQSGNMASRTRKIRDESVADRIGRVAHDDWNGGGRLLYRAHRRRRSQYDNIDFQSHEFGSNAGKSLVDSIREAPLDGEILSLGITKLPHTLGKSIENFGYGSARCARNESDPPDLPCLLYAGSERQHRCHPAEQCDEFASSYCCAHSITSSASCWRRKGTSRPIALAVLRLMTSSNLVGACTGSSAGLSPLRMRSTYAAARRKLSVRSTP